jgi:hypothetical protein
MIDFEKDQESVIQKTENIHSLADQVERLQQIQEDISKNEEYLKQKKKELDHISGEVIPTMLSEMGLSYLKLTDGSSIEVKTNYSATITEANKEAAFNWLRQNGLGDIIKNEISVSFGRNEDNKAADYAELAKGQGFQPTQKLKVEPMTLKALVRERIEAGKEMPNTVTSEIFDGEKGIDVLPVHYKRQLVEWQDRGESKGAPVAIHEASSDIMSKTTRDKSYKDRLLNGNYIENTANHFVVLLGKNPTTALISMKSTQLKISRKWNSMMMGIKLQGKNGLYTPPTYSHIYKLKTVQLTNDKGTWFGWDVSMIGPVQDKAVYEIAKNFATSVTKGEIQVKHETAEENSKTKKTLDL